MPISNGVPGNTPTPSKESPLDLNEAGTGNENNEPGTGPPNRPNSVPPQQQQQPGQPGLGPNTRPPPRRPPRGFGFFPSLPNLAELFGL